MSARGRVSEIFFSFQGEGIYLGEPQIFIRFADCNIHPGCIYCDTEIKIKREISVAQILNKIEKEKWPAKSVSLTGGEPLLQVNFLKKLLPCLKRKKFRTYLETNGTLPEALKHIIKDINIIAMDIKLPSSGKTTAFWKEHRRFLEAGRKKEVLIKVVVTGDTEKSDFEKAVNLASKNPSIPFILQPVTPNRGVKGIGEKKLKEFYTIARHSLKDVRIIPQVHALLGIR